MALGDHFLEQTFLNLGLWDWEIMFSGTELSKSGSLGQSDLNLGLWVIILWVRGLREIEICGSGRSFSGQSYLDLGLWDRVI